MHVYNILLKFQEFNPNGLEYEFLCTLYSKRLDDKLPSASTDIWGAFPFSCLPNSKHILQIQEDKIEFSLLKKQKRGRIVK